MAFPLGSATADSSANILLNCQARLESLVQACPVALDLEQAVITLDRTDDGLEIGLRSILSTHRDASLYWANFWKVIETRTSADFLWKRQARCASIDTMICDDIDLRLSLKSRDNRRIEISFGAKSPVCAIDASFDAF
jgi:hypothetical protein